MGRMNTPRSRARRWNSVAKPGSAANHVEGPDHAHVAEVLDPRMRGDLANISLKHAALPAVGRDHVVLPEDVQHRQGGAAGERVAGIGVRVEEARAVASS